MSRSIIDNERECLVCGTTLNLERHHIFKGIPNRQNSEKYGLWIYLCNRHHTGSNKAVHNNRELDLELRQMGQEAFERVHGTRDDFIRTFGRSWL